MMSDAHKPPMEWFAVRRTKYSTSYQFYEPSIGNRETIEAIAPDGGNFEVVTLIDKRAFDELLAQAKALRFQASRVIEIRRQLIGGSLAFTDGDLDNAQIDLAIVVKKFDTYLRTHGLAEKGSE